MPNRIRAIKLENYLGASKSTTLNAESGNVLLIGPNNSGKSVFCGAIQLFKFLSQESFGNPDSGYFKFGVKSDDRIGIDLLHRGADRAILSVTFDVDMEGTQIGATLHAATIPKSKRCDVRIDIEINSTGTKQLLEVVAGDKPIFKRHTSTEAVKWVKTDVYAAQNGIAALLQRIGELPRELSKTVVSFAAKRYLEVGGGDPSNLDALANGDSLASWIRSANNPAANKAVEKERHSLLREFEQEFAKFIDATKININASDAGINLNVDGELMPIARLGTGIGECLIILLVCKIAGQSKLLPGMSVCVLEEPELFLHPKLQRQLVELIQSYGVQLIASTHSPTVLDCGWRAGWKIFATKFELDNKSITITEVPRTGIGAVLTEIGVRPSDWLQSDGILFVEGPSDIPVFKQWIAKCPVFEGRSVSVIPVGGTMTANDHFDFAALNQLGRSVAVIMDSERVAPGAEPPAARKKVTAKCAEAGIPCHLTERLATENYFTDASISKVYGEGAKLGPFEKPNLIKNFSKQRNGEVASHMDWADIGETDIGKALAEFGGRLA